MAPLDHPVKDAGVARILRGGRLSLVASDGRELASRSFDFPEATKRPFLKWTGGKQWLAPLAEWLRPREFEGVYYEPFLGGGALFFALAPQSAVLGDLNRELVTTYRAVRDDAERLIRTLEDYPHDLTFYNAIRIARPRAPYRVGARLVYLNKTAFNGMYRVNRDGQFNVPFGRYVRPTLCPRERLHGANCALQSATLKPGDFATTVSTAEAGDWVYLDPPYITGHQNNGFRKYNSRLFAWADQERLAQKAHELRQRGVFVLVSNGDHQAIRDLYSDWYIVRVERNSLINADVRGRGPVKELLLSSYPLPLLRLAS
jgi:DNA adenine methylase